MQRASIGHPKRTVSIVQRSGKLAKDLNKSVRWTLLQQMEQAGVVTHVNASIASIGKETVTIVDADRSVRDIPCDTLVVAAGIAADDKLYNELRNNLTAIPVHLVGDAVAARQATEALLEGYVAANSI